MEWFPQALYQMDRYHITRDLRRLLREVPVHLTWTLAAYRGGQVVQLQNTLAQALDEIPPGDVREELRDLLLDIGSHPESCVDYRRRLERMGIDTRGMLGMGAAESTVDRFCNRTRKRG